MGRVAPWSIDSEHFLQRLNHSSDDFVQMLAKLMQENLQIPINLQQSKPDLIQTMFALYFHEPGNLPAGGILPADKFKYFSMEEHMNTPFGDTNKMRQSRLYLLGKYGVNQEFSRKEATLLLQEYAEKNKPKIIENSFLLLFSRLRNAYTNLGHCAYIQGNRKKGTALFYKVTWINNIPHTIS